MDLSGRKRPRSANWDEKEKLAFLSIVKNHLPIVEDKNKTIICNKRKDEAWQTIQRCMCQIGYKRDAYRLREQWLRMKAQAKKTIKTYHKELGEFRSDAAPPTSVDYMIRDIVPLEFVEDEDNPEDSVELMLEGGWPEGAQGSSEEDEISLRIEPTVELNEPLDVEDEQVEPANEQARRQQTNDGDSTDSAEASEDVSPLEKPDFAEDNLLASGCPTRKLPKTSHRQLSSYESASLELVRMKTETAMSQQAELHRVKMEAALWERRFWEAKLLRLRGYRV